MRAVVIALFALWLTPEAPRAEQEPGQPPPAPQPAESYAAIVERLVAGDRNIDFTRLRMAFTETPEYRGTMMAAYQALWQPLAKGDFAQAIAVSEKVLAQNYAEPNAHMVASVAYQQTGEVQKAEFHRFVAGGLLRSITSTGDGQSNETPYEVMDISEEYALMRSMNLQPKNVGSGFLLDGQVVDSMTAVDPRTGSTSTIYFKVKGTPRSPRPGPPPVQE
jgi:hypothetical protein